MSHGQRRKFLLAAGALLTAPLVTEAQRANTPRIGVLIVANPEPFLTLFHEGLRSIGYVDGENIRIEFRSADGKLSLLPDLAAELVRLKVDAVVAVQTPAVMAARGATNTIPIVMAPAADPVGSGLVASLARPGGNITGLSFATAELMGKNLEFLREIIPTVRRVAFLGVAADPVTKTFVSQLQHAGSTLGIEVRPMIIGGSADGLGAAFVQIVKERMGAVVLQPSLPRKPAADLALAQRLPAISPNRGLPEAGGLMSYAGSLEEVYRKAPTYLLKILKGGRPADLPIEQPTKFELVINVKTATVLGIKIPQSLLARADHLIE